TVAIGDPRRTCTLAEGSVMPEFTSGFKLGIVRDVLNAAGEPSFGAAALDVLKGNPRLEWEYTAVAVKEVSPDIAARYDGLYVNSSRVGAATVARGDCRLRIVARHGVGYASG